MFKLGDTIKSVINIGAYILKGDTGKIVYVFDNGGYGISFDKLDDSDLVFMRATEMELISHVR